MFDQRHRDGSNRQMLQIDETAYADDPEMMRILYRLVAAATDPKIRQDMNVEEECISIIEKRDTEIMMRDKRIEEQARLIEVQGKQLEEQGKQLEAKAKK